MASRIAGNLFAIVSLSPIVDDSDGCMVYSCTPLDMTPDGDIDEGTRFVTMLSVPPNLKSSDLFVLFDYARPYSTQWITYLWEVA